MPSSAAHRGARDERSGTGGGDDGRIQRPPAGALAAAATVVALAGPAHAAGSVVTVTLRDTGPGSVADVGHGMPTGVAATAPAGETGMAIEATPRGGQGRRGDVRGHQHVQGPRPRDDPGPGAGRGKAVPYDEQKGLIDEDAAGHLGEVSELEPGKSGALRLDLKPGRYALICNVPGHYVAGMWRS